MKYTSHGTVLFIERSIEQVADSFSDARLARDSQNPEILMEMAVLRSLSCRTPVDGTQTPIPKIDIFEGSASYDFPQIEDFEEEEEMAYSGTETKELKQEEEINEVKPEIKNTNEILAQRHTLPSEWVNRLFIFIFSKKKFCRNNNGYFFFFNNSPIERWQHRSRVLR